MRRVSRCVFHQFKNDGTYRTYISLLEASELLLLYYLPSKQNNIRQSKLTGGSTTPTRVAAPWLCRMHGTSGPPLP